MEATLAKQRRKARVMRCIATLLGVALAVLIVLLVTGYAHAAEPIPVTIVVDQDFKELIGRTAFTIMAAFFLYGLVYCPLALAWEALFEKSAVYRKAARLQLLVFAVLAAIVVAFGCKVLPVFAAEPVPAAMLKYRSEIVRAARMEEGLNAPVAMYAGQVEQESGGNEEARSPVGAQGLAQFMPATARDLGRSRPDLGPAVPTNPGWALRAMVAYDLAQLRRITADTECDARIMALMAYNGGLGWVWRDQAEAKAQGLNPGSWAVVAGVNAGRSAANKDQNARYGPDIVLRRQPKYLAWGPGVMCQHPGIAGR